MKSVFIKNKFYVLILLIAVVVPANNSVKAAALSRPGRNVVVNGNIGKPSSVIGSYSIRTAESGTAYNIKEFTIEMAADDKSYWMDWRINKYLSPEDKEPVLEWSSGPGDYKEKQLEIELSGDMASGSLCYVSLAFSGNTAAVTSRDCTQKNKPDGIYIKTQTEADSVSHREDQSSDQNEDADAVEGERIKEIYYLRGSSPKFGIYQNNLMISTDSETGEIYAELKSDWFSMTGKVKRKAKSDFRYGDLSREGDVAYGHLLGDADNNGRCQLKFVFTNQKVEIQAVKCDIGAPLSGIYLKK